MHTSHGDTLVVLDLCDKLKGSIHIIQCEVFHQVIIVVTLKVIDP